MSKRVVVEAIVHEIHVVQLLHLVEASGLRGFTLTEVESRVGSLPGAYALGGFTVSIVGRKGTSGHQRGGVRGYAAENLCILNGQVGNVSWAQGLHFPIKDGAERLEGAGLEV